MLPAVGEELVADVVWQGVDVLVNVCGASAVAAGANVGQVRLDCDAVLVLVEGKMGLESTGAGRRIQVLVVLYYVAAAAAAEATRGDSTYTLAFILLHKRLSTAQGWAVVQFT